ncbi:MAG: hypothetical protein QNJ41_09400 [Xenococcaceae cyanobacterium MO_188.B32]|nr:hypothetical protein [Xenococcaceae cyanobacterium MO_188.B32]
MHNVIILGSGRSGTSMVTGVLAKAGYQTGNNYLGQNNSNPKGFFEDYEVNTINEDILSLVIPHCPEIIRKQFFPSMTYYRARWLARIKPGIAMKTKPSINERIKKIISSKSFCYKDPRFSYTLPVWRPFLDPKGTVFICVFREPFNTAISIVKECQDSQALHPLKMTKNIALKVWLYMYQHILRQYEEERDKSRWLFVHFNQILTGEGLEKIQLLTKASVDKTFPDKSFNRTKIQEDTMPKKIEHIYKKLCSLASYY